MIVTAGTAKGKLPQYPYLKLREADEVVQTLAMMFGLPFKWYNHKTMPIGFCPDPDLKGYAMLDRPVYKAILEAATRGMIPRLAVSYIEQETGVKIPPETYKKTVLCRPPLEIGLATDEEKINFILSHILPDYGEADDGQEGK